MSSVQSSNLHEVCYLSSDINHTVCFYIDGFAMLSCCALYFYIEALESYIFARNYHYYGNSSGVRCLNELCRISLAPVTVNCRTYTNY